MVRPDPVDHPMLLIDWLYRYALPLWWTKGADHRVGGFHESLDAAGEPMIADRRARVIARQVYVYAAAAHEGAPGPWREAAQHGLSFMLDRFIRPDGLIRARLSPEGAPLDDEVTLYDQAFCLFALGWSVLAGLGGDELLARAGALLDVLERDWRAPGEGFLERGGPPRQSNPHMHLLEAFLTLEAAGGGRRWAEAADRIVALCLSRFIDSKSGALGEFYGLDWSPPAEGQTIEPGHQFEWAWLLANWARIRGQPEGAHAAERLYTLASRCGVDPVRGVAIDALDSDLAIINANARLWPQTERIKAAAVLAQGCKDRVMRAKLEADVARAADGLRLYLTPRDSGLWRDRLMEDGRFVPGPSPASSLYHIALALLDAKARGFVL